MDSVRSVIACFMIGLLSSPLASACTAAPFVEEWTNYGTVNWITDEGGCVLRSSAGLPNLSAAIAHFRRADPQAPIRLSFVIDPPSIATLSPDQSVSLARGTARSVPAGGPTNASLFEISLLGNLAGTSPRIGLAAACAGAAGSYCATTMPVDFSDFPLRITLELDMGAGSAGQLRAWLGENTSGAPSATLDNLDNAAWNGIDRVSLGVSNMSASLAALAGDQAFSFSGITVSDPQLFWDDFDGDLANDIEFNGAPIDPITSWAAGNTCGGSTQLPSIASGSLRLTGPAVVHELVVTEEGNHLFRLLGGNNDLTLFVCPRGSGPSGPCLGTTLYELAESIFLPVGDYQVVVASLRSSCGEYSLAIQRPIGN